MKLLHVSVEGCGRFGTPARIEGFGAGVNILSARNEAGKSTLFRAIRTCLFERHSSTAKDIAGLATDGLSLPVSIKVGFEHDGKRYEIAKSFLKSKAASLTRDGVEIARNAEADEQVWDMLGIAPKSTRALDEASYGLLWVQQGHSFNVPEPSEAAASQLNAVIQQEVGTLVGGERARQLLGTVKDELGRFLTESGKPKTGGPLHAAIETSADITTQRLEAESQLAALDEKLDELSRLRADLRTAGDPGVALAMKTDLDDSKRKLDEAEKAGEELRRLIADEKQVHALAEAQADKLTELKRRAAGIDAQRARVTELVKETGPIEQEMTAVSAALAQVTERKARLDADSEALDAEDRDLVRLTGLTTRLAQRENLSARLDLLERLRSRAAANDAALKAARVDDAAVKALEALENEDARLRARQDAAAPRVAIEAAPGTGVRLDGAAVSGIAARAVTEPVVITVGADVTITVTPPQATREADEKALSEHRDRLRALLAACGAADAAELRRLRAERLTLEEQARDIKAERNALALKDGVTAEIERLQAAIGEIDAEARRDQTDGAPLPSADEIAQRRQAAAERRSVLRAELAGARAEIEAQKEALSRLRERRAALQGQSEQIHSGLSSDLALLPDEQRAAMLDECEAELTTRRDAHRIKAALVAEKQKQAPEDGEIERLRSRVDRLVAAIRGQQEKLEKLGVRIAHVEGEVKVAGGDGLGERAATLKLQQEMALAEQARLTERVEVLKLLRTTVDDCYAERREQLNAPLRRHLKPFLHDVFPKAEIELGENFAIAGLNRAGPAAEIFGRLSLGTQEQIAVLVRLAMGAMICERGSDVPIILDDALVFSDDDRIEQMFDAINRAGKNQQVIVLTCRSRSFTSLGGTQLQIT
ncbi:MAG: AAA family ATPase [Aestuariivirga sp.]|uniref:AAA family ATPase n=1 Tax=Aestuariivirga sp. TaxID=2650926 RepID=UPI00301A611D